MNECIECGEEMNPVQAMLSSTHGVCGSCTKWKHHQVAIGKREWGEQDSKNT